MEHTESDWALIIAGGRPIQPATVARLDVPDWIVAADSGLDHAYDLGIDPDVVVGDMDSVTEQSLARAKAEGVEIRRYPADKDATDLELAIDAVVDRGFRRAVIIGGTGGRLAHTLGNALLLTRPQEISLEWATSHATISMLATGESGHFLAGDGVLVSVLAIDKPAACTSTGLRWPLDGTELSPGTTRGISNEISGSAAEVTVRRGRVLTVQERE